MCCFLDIPEHRLDHNSTSGVEHGAAYPCTPEFGVLSSHLSIQPISVRVHAAHSGHKLGASSRQLAGRLESAAEQILDRLPGACHVKPRSSMARYTVGLAADGGVCGGGAGAVIVRRVISSQVRR